MPRSIPTILKTLPKVENIQGPNGAVRNQIVITTQDCRIFKSYDSIVAVKMTDGTGRVILNEETWDFSSTTNRWRGWFLGEGRAETLKKIRSGEYRLARLDAPMGGTR